MYYCTSKSIIVEKIVKERKELNNLRRKSWNVVLTSDENGVGAIRTYNNEEHLILKFYLEKDLLSFSLCNK